MKPLKKTYYIVCQIEKNIIFQHGKNHGEFLHLDSRPLPKVTFEFATQKTIRWQKIMVSNSRKGGLYIRSQSTMPACFFVSNVEFLLLIWGCNGLGSTGTRLLLSAPTTPPGAGWSSDTSVDLAFLACFCSLLLPPIAFAWRGWVGFSPSWEIFLGLKVKNMEGTEWIEIFITALHCFSDRKKTSRVPNAWATVVIWYDTIGWDTTLHHNMCIKSLLNLHINW